MSFVVFSLPRSRSAWLSAFLGCGHDVGIECSTPEEFLGRLPSCETGAAFAWPLIRQLAPNCRFVVVRRPVEDVCASFQRLGIAGIEPEMRRRAAQLDEISALPETLTVAYGDLPSPAVCGGIYAHCLGRPMDIEHWRRFDGLNIQVDIVRQLARLEAYRPRIAALKAEVARRLAKPGLNVAQEPWSEAFWYEAKPLAEAHFEEVDGGVEPNRPFNLDTGFMQKLSDAGILQLFTARVDGRLVGYFTWNVTNDVESAGLLIAQQGAWYVAPGHPKAACEMFRASREGLKAMGVKFAFPHHRMQGRGDHLGRFFQRQGAKPIQVTYSLEL